MMDMEMSLLSPSSGTLKTGHLFFVLHKKNPLDKIHCDTKAKYDLIMSLSLHFQQIFSNFLTFFFDVEQT